MNDPIKSFLRNNLILSIVLLAITVLLNYTVPTIVLPKITAFIILFFFTITMVIHYLFIKLTHGKPTKFVSGFMATTTIKLFIYCIIIISYSFANKATAIPFIITFFSLYLIYTVFEIISILPYIKKQ